MVKYKVNLKFKENSKSLNDIIIDALKMELEKSDYITGNILNKDESSKSTIYSKNKRSIDLES